MTFTMLTGLLSMIFFFEPVTFKGLKKCSDFIFAQQFCTSTNPIIPWRNAPDHLGSHETEIFFQNGKSIECCNMIETLKQCELEVW